MQTDDAAFQQLMERAASLSFLVRKHRVSKYNDGRARGSLGKTTKERILVVDQTFGDASIEGGLANQNTFREMLESTRQKYPMAEIVVKRHPEVVRGTKRGCIDENHLKDGRFKILAENIGPYELLENVDHVVTVTSQLGFDALCAGKTVTCFGMPFYAGFGLTEDRVAVDRRTQRRSLSELCAAAWLLYPSYVHPLSGERCDAEEVVEHLGLQRRCYLENEGSTLAVGFSRWKQPFVAPFLEGPDGPAKFAQESELEARVEREKPARVVHWGQRLSPHVRESLRGRGVRVECMEDGFLRSNALGSDLTQPLSIVRDSSGIYYDSTAPSDLEQFLVNHSFSDLERAEGLTLMEVIRASRLSKYNVQKDAPLDLPKAGRVLLVVGQVDDDAAIQLGTKDVGSNEALLRRVRHEHPQAFLLYKPHPDVLSGNRRGALPPEVENLADWVEKERSIGACLDVATEVHTMSSLVGFEALVRGLLVDTYGTPFYAGWGLTRDHLDCGRRGRSLALEELVFATLCHYPRYFEHSRGCFLTAQEAAHVLATSRDSQGRGDASPTLRRKWMRLRRYLGGFFRRA